MLLHKESKWYDWRTIYPKKVCWDHRQYGDDLKCFQDFNISPFFKHENHKDKINQEDFLQQQSLTNFCQSVLLALIS